MADAKQMGQGAEAVELRMREAPGHVSVAIATFEAMVSGDPTREGGEHAGKFIERPATHHGDGAAEPVGQLAQKMRQLRRHPH